LKANSRPWLNGAGIHASAARGWLANSKNQHAERLVNQSLFAIIRK
jgi:hypothetical protein